MTSEELVRGLSREVVGQPRAVGTVARAAVLAKAGFPSDCGHQGPLLLVGPTGTGKTHLARSLARTLHGGLSNLIVVDCVQFAQGEEWPSFLKQVAPHFARPSQGVANPVASIAPSSVLLVEHLEWCRPEFVQMFTQALKEGTLLLPSGGCGWLSGTVVLFTTRLCSGEILDSTPSSIGFTPAGHDPEVHEKARIFQACASVLERRWGADAMAAIEETVVFHRLRLEHLPSILGLLLDRLTARLAPAGSGCVLDAAARDFVVSRGSRNLQHGAWWLVRAFRRFVDFPVADLILANRIPPGAWLVATHEEGEDHLRFHLESSIRAAEAAGVFAEVPVGA